MWFTSSFLDLTNVTEILHLSICVLEQPLGTIQGKISFCSFPKFYHWLSQFDLKENKWNIASNGFEFRLRLTKSNVIIYVWRLLAKLRQAGRQILFLNRILLGRDEKRSLTSTVDVHSTSTRLSFSSGQRRPHWPFSWSTSTRLRFSWSTSARLSFSSDQRRPDWGFPLVGYRVCVCVTGRQSTSDADHRRCQRCPRCQRPFLLMFSSRPSFIPWNNKSLNSKL